MMRSGPNVADWLTAIGTTAAVGAALGIALSPSVVRWVKRPKLKPLIGSTEPFVRETRGPDQGVNAAYFRLGIRNDGRLTALKVRAHVMRWWFKDEQPTQGLPEWRNHDIDPSSLHWVAMPHAEMRPGLPPEVELPPGITDFVDLAVQNIAGSRFSLLLDDLKDRGFKRDFRLRTGEFRCEVVVTVANAQPLTRVIAFEAVNGVPYFVNVRFSEPPREALPTGKLTLFDRFNNSLPADPPSNESD